MKIVVRVIGQLAERCPRLTGTLVLANGGDQVSATSRFRSTPRSQCHF